MSVINDYLSGLKKQYPPSKELDDQIEELRDSLHNKTEENQASGMGYDEAAKAAINSLGDVKSLLDEVSGILRAVYINRLKKDNALLSYIIVLAEFAAAFLVTGLIISGLSIRIPFLWPMFLYMYVAIIVSYGIWPLMVYIPFRKDPGRKADSNMPYKKLIATALICWGALSLVLFAINALTGLWIPWFIYALLGISNWPLNIYCYHRQLISGRYDVSV